MSWLDKEEEFTDMQFMNLLTQDMAYDKARRIIMFKSNSMDEYNKSFWAWKNEFRNRYSAKYLKKQGINPYSTGKAIVLDEVKILTYIQQTEASTCDDIYSVGTSYPETHEIGRFYLQNNGYDWTNYTNTLVEGGVAYTTYRTSYTYLSDDPYDSDLYTHITLDFTNDTGDEFSIEIVNNFYKECLDLRYKTTDLPDEEWFVYLEDNATVPDSLYSEEDVELTAMIPIKENNIFNEEILDMNKMLNKFGISGDDMIESLSEKDKKGKDKIDNAYILNGLPMRDPYQVRVGLIPSAEASTLSAGLLRQADFVNSADDPGWTSWMSEVLGMPQTTPEEYFYKEYMINEYIKAYKTIEDGYYVINFELQHSWREDNIKESSAIAKALFQTMKYYNSLTKDGEGLTHIGMKYLDMTYQYNMEIEHFEGKLGRRDYADSNIDIPPYDGEYSDSIAMQIVSDAVLTIRWQYDRDSYYVMKITNFMQLFTISGKQFTGHLGNSARECRMMVPIEVMNGLKFREYVSVQEYSFTMIVYAYEKVVVKWYVRFMGVILAAVLCLVGGCGISVLIWKILEAIATILIMEVIMEWLDNEILQLIFSIAKTLLSMDFSNLDISTLTTENYLPIASAVLGVANLTMNTISGIESISNKDDELDRLEDEANKERLENIDEKIASGNAIVTKVSTSAHYAYNEINSPDVFFAQSQGSGLYNFEQYYDVSGNLALRVQVKSG